MEKHPMLPTYSSTRITWATATKPRQNIDHASSWLGSGSVGSWKFNGLCNSFVTITGYFFSLPKKSYSKYSQGQLVTTLTCPILIHQTVTTWLGFVYLVIVYIIFSIVIHHEIPPPSGRIAKQANPSWRFQTFFFLPRELGKWCDLIRV